MHAYDLMLTSLSPLHNMSLVMAIVWAINNDYAKYTTSPLTLAQYATSSASENFQKELMDAVLKLTTISQEEDNIHSKTFLIGSSVDAMLNSNGTLHLNIQSLYTRLLIKREIAIWFVDSLAAYKRLEAVLLNANNIYYRNGFFCIVYTGTQHNRLRIISDIFRRLFDIYVLNINVFLTYDEKVYVFTYHPFTSRKCLSIRPILHVAFADIRDYKHFNIGGNRLFFETKLSNMHGCKVTVITWEYPPYVLIEPKSNRLLGIEGRIFETLAEKMNFSIQLIEEPNKDRGVIFDNGTITGAVKMVVDGLANITFVCYFYNKQRSDIMLPSIAYISFPVVLCIPRGKLLSPFMRLIKPFRYIIWSCLSTSVFFGICFIVTIKIFLSARKVSFVFGSYNQTPLLNFWSILFGNLLTTPMPRRDFARYLLIVWLLYTLVLRTAYTGELYLLLQDASAHTTVKTVYEAVHHDYVFHMMPNLKEIFTTIMPSIKIKLLDTTDNTTLANLQRLHQDTEANIVMPVLLPTVKVYNQQHSTGQMGRVNILKEPLITAPLALYMRKNSFLKHRINELLLAMMSSGIVHHFENMYLDPRRDIARKSDEIQPTILSLWLLFGVFAIYILLLIFSAVVFSLEILTNRSIRLRRIVEKVNYYFC